VCAAGSNISVDSHRTSDTAFDTSSDVSITLKKRAFDMLGIRPYDKEWADGIQVLRYNVTGGYNTHHDFFDGSDYTGFDESSTNRFATVFLYLSDVDEGGETVFPLGGLVDENTMAVSWLLY
jgi:prolyl 4-hydroxylase